MRPVTYREIELDTAVLDGTEDVDKLLLRVSDGSRERVASVLTTSCSVQALGLPFVSPLSDIVDEEWLESVWLKRGGAFVEFP
jgi:hypothetical protein